MKNLVILCGLFIFGLISASTSFAQRQGSALAAVPVPGQPVTPVAPTPTPTTPQVPGVSRPATPTAPGAKPEEQLRIVADTATNSLIIYGTAQEFQNIRTILKELDAVPRQVLLEVLIFEVTLDNTERLGVDYEIKSGNTPFFGLTFPSRGSLLTGILNLLNTTSTTSGTSAPGGVTGIFGGNTVRALVNALMSDSRVKILSAPSVLASDNRPARIQVGSQQPVATGSVSTPITTTTTAGTGFATSSTIQYQNTGRIVTIIPQVNSQGLVNLQILAEVSAINQTPSGTVTLGTAGTFPSFDIRQAETTAVVQDGDSLAIGGIIAENRNESRSGVPYLMDLPVLGRLFRTTSSETLRTELIFLITPHVIRNRSEGTAVTEEFKSKLTDLRNELDKFESDRVKAKAKQLPPPGAVQPDVKPPLPAPAVPIPQAPAPAVPMPQGPTPAPTRAPGVSGASMAPANTTSIPAEQVSPTTPSVNAKVEPAPNIQFQMETSSTAGEPGTQPQEAETYATEKDTIGTLLDEIETNGSQSTSIAMAPKPQTVKPAQVWVVQVASFAKDVDARNLADRLRDKGYDVSVATAEVGGKTWHRVEVGHLASRSEALRLQKNLQAAEKIEQSIVASR